MARPIALALTLGALLWTVAMVGAASLPGVAPSAFIYTLGSVICHQRPERSFALDGQSLPVCARCTGLYISGAIGALLAWLGSGRESRRTRDIPIIAAIPTLLTLSLEWTGISRLSNVLRALAAVPLGAAAGWIFVRALRSEDDAL